MYIASHHRNHPKHVAVAVTTRRRAATRKIKLEHNALLVVLVATAAFRVDLRASVSERPSQEAFQKSLTVKAFRVAVWNTSRTPSPVLALHST